jgi:predicted RNase H-like HicB family nuclease
MKMNVIIEKDTNGFYAYCPVLPGCQSQGDTFEQAFENIREAIDLYMETLSEEEAIAFFSKEIITASVEVTVG